MTIHLSELYEESLSTQILHLEATASAFIEYDLASLHRWKKVHVNFHGF
jgi:hypothetical protein